MASVWIVTSGEYSDYQIEGVFSTEEFAERYVKSLDKGDADASEYRLDDWEPQRTFWRVRLWDDTMEAVFYGCWRQEDRPESLNQFTRTCRADAVKGMSLFFSDRSDDRLYWEGWVQAETKERAIKVATEQVAMAKAQSLGMT